MKPLTITRKLDSNGTAMAIVPLENVDQSAVLYLEDWYLLLALGTDPRWSLHANLVLAKGKLPVSRLILDAGKLEKVFYRDGSPLNLIRSNLIKAIGGAARSRTRDKLQNKPFRIRSKANLEYVDINPDHFKTIAA